ncbi:hypothetical protein CY34DRAFT_813380 [Suillus luteus UH-Slu-Lm8-n1]|uniref:Uncharacterized protein n=1 Tax=Suillus luteus UH-Slu-Lm8-n1 TaxID=930992 RepID=A0A0D0AP40_9AGAM|nr:hypothetical protein CY34DRAFT_813380 [Suillus luteus UH-Slu-Lm8-n1]
MSATSKRLAELHGAYARVRVHQAQARCMHISPQRCRDEIIIVGRLPWSFDPTSDHASNCRVSKILRC